MTEEPSFAYDVGRKWMLFIPITLLFFVLGVELFLSRSELYVAFIFFLIAFGLVPTLLRYSKPKLRKALFFDDRVELWERNEHRTVGYAQVAKIELLKPTLTGSKTALYLFGEKDPLGMITNPKSKALETDLVSWIKAKVGPSKEGAHRVDY